MVRQWIVNNDRTKGVSTKEVAEALDIQAAAVWRMNQLLKRELVRRVNGATTVPSNRGER